MTRSSDSGRPGGGHALLGVDPGTGSVGAVTDLPGAPRPGGRRVLRPGGRRGGSPSRTSTGNSAKWYGQSETNVHRERSMISKCTSESHVLEFRR